MGGSIVPKRGGQTPEVGAVSHREHTSIDPKEIKGIRVSDRAHILPDIRFNTGRYGVVLDGALATPTA